MRNQIVIEATQTHNITHENLHTAYNLFTGSTPAKEGIIRLGLYDDIEGITYWIMYVNTLEKEVTHATNVLSETCCYPFNGGELETLCSRLITHYRKKLGYNYRTDNTFYLHTPQQLGGYLKYRRRVQNLTLTAVSGLLDISIGYVSRIENGSSKPSAKLLVQYRKVLKCDTEHIALVGLLQDLNNDIQAEIQSGTNTEADDIMSLLMNNAISINGTYLTKDTKSRLGVLLTELHTTDLSTEVNRINIISQLLTYIERINNHA